MDSIPDTITTRATHPAVVGLPRIQRWLEFVGERVSIRISVAESGGTCSVVEGGPGPMSGPPLHIHQNEDELIQVLEGWLRFVLDGKAFDAAAGACVLIPAGRRTAGAT